MDYSRTVPNLNSLPTKAPVKDQALCTLVKAANAGAEFGVTLVFDGQVVSGDLISGKAYCEAMNEYFLSSSGSKEVLGFLAGYFQEMGENSYTKDDLGDIPLNYLHLKNSAFLKGDGSFLATSGAFFRVAIDRVTAFTPGRPNN